MDHDDDSGLAGLAAAGDRTAFVRLLDRHGGRVRSIALRMAAGDHARADDWTQDLFMRLCSALPQYDRSRPFAPWLFRVAANLFRNRIRDERRRPHESLDRLAEGGGFEPCSTSSDPAAVAELRDEAARIRTARDSLPAAYREILALRYEAGLSHEEIQSALGGLALGTVKNRLHRARAALAASLGVDLAEGVA